ncbi:MAG: formylglycine-generating enzyme family protein, partial [Pseudomonadota bacterium]
FKMGDIQGGGDSDEQPLHDVSVGRFAMGRYEVTVGEFRRFVNATGYKTDAEKEGSCYTYKDSSWQKVKGVNWRNPNFSQDSAHPVVCVSWNDATTYAKWLATQTGKQYRLPTEAEWEYAARAGTKTARYWGNNPDDACGYANVHDNTSKRENGFGWAHHKCTDGYAKTAPVGRFKPNGFGLFDMLGNVWEWTCSEYENKYSGKEQRCLSKNIASNKSHFVLRGGSWFVDVRWTRTALRLRWQPSERDRLVGFRLARLP